MVSQATLINTKTGLSNKLPRYCLSISQYFFMLTYNFLQNRPDPFLEQKRAKVTKKAILK
jgi:hypothetical protein